MALSLVRQLDRIEVVFTPQPVLQVRYVDRIVDDADGTVVADKGYHRETFDTKGDLSSAPIQVQAAAAAMDAFQKANPDADATVKTLDPRQARP